ncbi:MAG: LysM peptidoglycan-binding domain-containing protein [Caldilinea sp. CFX5]|nr:LysM peptidoglycan-binding domain-containing protein [Caldilinea sp. CFX5]
MNRRQLLFIIILNSLISLVVALAVFWAVEARRPDPEELAIRLTPSTPIETLVTPVTDPNGNPNPPVAEAPTAEQPAEPTAAPTPTLDPANQQIYTIQSGDSLSAVAGRFGTTVDAIMQANELKDANVIFVGQRLIIPVANGGNSASPAENNAPATTAPLSNGQGVLIRTVDGPGTLVTEAVQIVNDSNDVVNLNGWRLERENGPAYTFVNQNIFPGSNLWLHTGSGDDTTVALYWGQSEPVWQSGSVVRLLNAEGALVNSYTVP